MSPMPKFEIRDFDRFLISGMDKHCYLSEKYPGKILKISPLSKSNQIIREIKYFQFLKHKHISPSFMPEFFGLCSDNRHIGYVQEYIAGEGIMRLSDIIMKDYETRLDKIEDAILLLRQEMLNKNIIILDLHCGNILGDINSLRLWIIEGYGTSEFIPLPQYLRFFGRLKIERQWQKFIERYGRHLTAVAKKKGKWVPSRLVSGPV